MDRLSPNGCGREGVRRQMYDVCCFVLKVEVHIFPFLVKIHNNFVPLQTQTL